MVKYRDRCSLFRTNLTAESSGIVKDGSVERVREPALITNTCSAPQIPLVLSSDYPPMPCFYSRCSALNGEDFVH